MLSHQILLWRHVAVGTQTNTRPSQKQCPTHLQAAFLLGASPHSAVARNASLCSSANVLRVVRASRRRAAPRSQSVGPPKGGKCPTPVTLGRRYRLVQLSFRLPPARPNPSFNLSANSRSLGPHSAVVYRRTVRPKRPAVVARLTQTLGHATKPNAAPVHAAKLLRRRQSRRVAVCAQSSRSAFSPLASCVRRQQRQHSAMPKALPNPMEGCVSTCSHSA